MDRLNYSSGGSLSSEPIPLPPTGKVSGMLQRNSLPWPASMDVQRAAYGYILGHYRYRLDPLCSLVPRTSHRPPSAVARSARSCCTRCSRRCTMRCAACPS